ncbi:BON domain-containing protein [Hankyongella ginsenosidimutans]|uniref:BON domain-containing protein n=1 Tax=Hankyongella ginsenosidimutans TaxID=1763828 RepID=A0A4D7C5N0_9SPHN|nr:BON domain-containing protein [Hankyongella ginsenosidimutans]
MDGADQVIYAADVQVANNIDQIKTMLDTAMPETDIAVKTLNGLVVLEGTVATPEMVADAARLVQDFVGEKQKVVNNLTSVTPMQVNLQVKIAEVSRDVLKEVGFNAATRDKTGGFIFNISRGRNFVNIADRPLDSLPTADASSFSACRPGRSACRSTPALASSSIQRTPAPRSTSSYHRTAVPPSALPASCSASMRRARSTRWRRKAWSPSSPNRTSPPCPASSPASWPAANSRSRWRRNRARSRSNSSRTGLVCRSFRWCWRVTASA